MSSKMKTAQDAHAGYLKAAPPLVVDLDGTLVNSDLLVESAFVLAHRSPLSLLRLPAWLRAGKARLKAEIAWRADLGIADLPYNEALIDYLREQRAAGRTLILATAANARYAQQVADHLGLFDAVLASDAQTNLSGQAKLDALNAFLDGGAFDYAGDHDSDRVIWESAREAIVVNANAKLAARMAAAPNIGRTFEREPAGWRTWTAALRVHQWAKNGLIFVPPLAAHSYTAATSVDMAVLAFIAFCLVASSVYLLNDLLDLGEDRQHPRKCARPFASGRLPILHGVAAIPALLLAACLIALLLPPFFWLVLASYYLLTLAYSLGIKQLELLDVLTLAALYTLRVIAGGAATNVDLSFWLLALSMSIFLSLAMAKRCTELLVMDQHRGSAPPGRGYAASDLPPLRSLGTAAGYTSVVILALYINSPDVAEKYDNPQLIWLLCPVVLYWISRIWLVTLRGQMHDDPIVFAARDPGSRLCLALGTLIVILAI